MKRTVTILMTIIFIVPIFALTAQEQAAPATTSASDFASGMKLYRQGRYAQAVSIFESIASGSPDYAAACYFAGYSHYVMRHYPEAVASFGKAFQANPAFDPRPYFRSR